MHRGTDGRELGKTRTCLLSPALCADAVVGQFGSVNAQQADSAEIPAVSVVDAHGVAVVDEGVGRDGQCGGVVAAGERAVAAGTPGHIFNLGHGIVPETPIAHVERLVRRVRG